MVIMEGVAPKQRVEYEGAICHAEATFSKPEVEVESLRKCICELKAENARLQERLDFLEHAPSLQAGMRGELLVAQVVEGRMTSCTAPHDIVVTNGLKLEVKFSHINTPNTAYPNSKRWSWGHPLGFSGAKDFDRLLLIGEADPRYRDVYKEPSSPYVIFDVPYEDAVKMNRKHHQISITTDPNRIGGKGSRVLLFQCFQTTLAELKENYGI